MARQDLWLLLTSRSLFLSLSLTHTCAHTHTDARTHRHAQTHAYTHTHIHTHTHTHTHRGNFLSLLTSLSIRHTQIQYHTTHVFLSLCHRRHAHLNMQSLKCAQRILVERMSLTMERIHTSTPQCSPEFSALTEMHAIVSAGRLSLGHIHCVVCVSTF